MTVPSMPSMSTKLIRRWTHSRLAATNSTPPSTKKTEVIYLPTSGKPYQKPDITVKGQRFQAVENFTYLGKYSLSFRQHQCKCQQLHYEGKQRLWEIETSVWERRGISQCTKIKVYRAVVLVYRTLLYGCETWTIYRRHEKLLQQFHPQWIRNIFQHLLARPDPLHQDSGESKPSSVITIMRKAQTRWAGPVSHMSDFRIPKQL